MGSTAFSSFVRGLVGVIGGIIFLLGVGVILAGEPAAGLWALVIGGVLLLIALYEQTRYVADRGVPSAGGPPGAPPGWGPPGGPALPGPGFERTAEVFDDPTTGVRLRVWFNPRTGERRYLPEP